MKLIRVFCLLLLSASAYAQTIKLEGKVNDQSGVRLPGATVVGNVYYIPVVNRTSATPNVALIMLL